MNEYKVSHHQKASLENAKKAKVFAGKRFLGFTPKGAEVWISMEMNRETKTYIQEVGQGEGNRNVVTETQDTIINVITNTKVIGYERWKIQIALTPNDEYRVYIGLQYPLEEYNKLKELVEKEMVAELNSITNNSEEAFNSLEEKI